jgi:hypothetical protein
MSTLTIAFEEIAADRARPAPRPLPAGRAAGRLQHHSAGARGARRLSPHPPATPQACAEGDPELGIT